MIHFNELRIKPENSHLVIDAAIDSNPIYTDVVLKTIYIDTQDTFTTSGPSERAIKYDAKRAKEYKIELELEELGLDFSKTMLFVYVEAEGFPDNPCAKKESIIIGTVVNLLLLYRQMILGIKEINNQCIIPKNFINLILQFKALELCIKTGNYIEAIKIWKSFNKTYIKTSNNICSCYGNN